MKPYDDRPKKDDEEEDFGPSRSELRRNALDMLKLAKQLVELPPSRSKRLLGLIRSRNNTIRSYACNRIGTTVSV